MKKYIIIIIISCLGSQLFGQSVNLENSFLIESSQSLISFQRVEVSLEKASFKYDYKSSEADALGLILPRLISTPSFNADAMVIRKTEKGLNDQFIVESCLNKKIGQSQISFTGGYIMSNEVQSRSYISSRLTMKHFIAEGYMIDKTDKPGKKYYAWIAYSPEKFFISAGQADDKYWGFAGTRNMDRFGVFTYSFYHPETGNFKVKSQFGFGEINQKFFCENNYVVAANYLVIPSFFQKHFSQVATKGDYSLKLEASRNNGIYNFESMMGKKVGNEIVRMAVGINSEYAEQLKVAPSFELYKSWKKNDWRTNVEIRYDMLYKVMAGYLVLQF